MAQAAYVEEDVLVGHQWEEMPLVLRSLMPQCSGMPEQEGWSWWVGRGAPSLRQRGWDGEVGKETRKGYNI